MSRDMRDVSPGTYVLNPDASLSAGWLTCSREKRAVVLTLRGRGRWRPSWGRICGEGGFDESHHRGCSRPSWDPVQREGNFLGGGDGSNGCVCVTRGEG